MTMLTQDLLNWAIRGSLLLGTGYLIARLLELKSAAIAHRVLIATVGCVFVLPLANVLIPSWQWATPVWLSARTVESVATAKHAATASDDRLMPAPVVRPVDFIEMSPLPADDVEITSVPAESPRTESQSTVVAKPLVSPNDQPAVSVPLLPVSSGISWTWQNVAAAIWFIVAVLLSCRLLSSIGRLWKFVKGCSPASDSVATTVERTAARLKLRRRLNVVLSQDDSMPMACWLGSWVIVLPANITSWSPEMREATLAHELGHIARRDAWSDFLLQCVSCLLWLNPLSWLTVRDARRLRERACDEWVLQRSTINVTTYAQNLLEVVERCRCYPLRLASEMAGRRDLETRLRWLVSESRPKVARPRTTAAITFGILAMGLTIAIAQPVEPKLASTPESAADSTDADSVHELNEVVVRAEPPQPGAAISVDGVVVDTDGRPLDDMHVVLMATGLASQQFGGQIRHKGDVLARTTTNADGRFEFDDVGIPPRMTPVLNNLRQGKPGAQLFVWGDQKGAVWEPIQAFQAGSKKIQLMSEADVSGVVLDEQGLPLHDATLSIVGFVKDAANLSVFLDAPGDLALHESEVQIRTISAQGHFSIPNVPQGVLVSLVCTGAQGQRVFFLTDTEGDVIRKVTYQNGRRTEMDLFCTPIRVTAKQHPWVKIRIIDHNGNRVSGGSLQASHETRRYGGRVDVGNDGSAVLIVNEPGLHSVIYSPDPLVSAVGKKMLNVDIQPNESATVEMRLLDPQFVTGHVLDGDTGTPVAGAWVYCWNSLLREQKVPGATHSFAVSNADGEFQLAVSNGQWSASLMQKIDGYFVPTFLAMREVKKKPAPAEFEVTPDNLPDGPVFKVAKGLAIRGTVIGEGGSPQAGATVFAENEKSPYDTASSVTDQNGQFELSGLSPYVSTRVSTWSDSGAAVVTITAAADHPWEKTRIETISLKLGTATTLTGRVILKGKPAAGINVKLLTAPPLKPGQNGTRFRLTMETTTDTNGRYVLSGLKKGDQYQIEVQTVGNAQVRDWQYQSPYINTNQSDDGESIELPDAKLVSNGQELRGIVVDPDGNPLEDVTVSAELVSGRGLSRPQSGPPPWTETDSKGRFHITNLPDEPISLMAYRSNPAGGHILYPAKITPSMNATDIRIVFDPTLGTGIEDLDAK